MISINEVQDEVIAEFNDFDDWMDRYQLLIYVGFRCFSNHTIPYAYALLFFP